MMVEQEARRGASTYLLRIPMRFSAVGSGLTCGLGSSEMKPPPVTVGGWWVSGQMAPAGRPGNGSAGGRHKHLAGTWQTAGCVTKPAGDFFYNFILKISFLLTTLFLLHQTTKKKDATQSPNRLRACTMRHNLMLRTPVGKKRKTIPRIPTLRLPSTARCSPLWPAMYSALWTMHARHADGTHQYSSGVD